jgi:hypothetical protein
LFAVKYTNRLSCVFDALIQCKIATNCTIVRVVLIP